MKKIIVIGCPGAGKSTFSAELHKKTGIPLFHLDMMYWNADKTTVPKSVFLSRLGAAMAEERWIVDGNYGSTLEMRLVACDTVFFLDFDTDTCLEGVRERKGRARPDMPWVETEDDGEFLEFIKNFRECSRPKIAELLEKYGDKNIFVFKSRGESDEFLREVLSENEKAFDNGI